MKILIAEDELDLQSAEKEYLEMVGHFSVDAVETGLDAVNMAKQNAYDVIILDIMMPKMNGLDALQTLRADRNFTPILMLTAKAELDDKLTGLDMGADDYLTKPFSMKELFARVKSLTRRRIDYMPTKLTYENLVLDTEKGLMSCVNSVSLAFKEAKMMELFIENPERIIPKEEIFEKIWKFESDSNVDSINIYVYFIKNKLKAIGTNLDIEINNNEYRLVKI